MTELIELIKRTTAPDQEVDYAIWRYISGASKEYERYAPEYTGRVDHAMMLIPDGYGYILRSSRGSVNASLFEYPALPIKPRDISVSESKETAPLAICLAAFVLMEELNRLGRYVDCATRPLGA